MIMGERVNRKQEGKCLNLNRVTVLFPEPSTFMAGQPTCPVRPPTVPPAQVPYDPGL